MINFRSFFIFFVLLLTWSSSAQNILVSLDSTRTPDVELGEIIIAASRDNSKIKDIPASITSIRSGTIEDNQIQSLEDINAYVPNFIMLDYGTKLTSPVYIRGIGSKKGSPSVGLYVDGIPHFDFSAFNFDFYDISQVEVLRGPQGTLYGRNTMGGLININTLSPINYQGTRLRLSTGAYGQNNVSLGHYGKVGNKLAYSISGNLRQEEGYFTNTYDGTMADELSSYGLRNRLLYQLTDKFSIENLISYENSQQGGYPFGMYIDSTQSVHKVNYNEISSYNRNMFNDGLKLKYETQEWETNATFSYQRVDDQQSIDQDFTTDSLYYVVQDQLQHMFSAEGIIRSKNQKHYNWLFGAFAFQQNLEKNVVVDIHKSHMQSLKDYNNTVSSFGLFHQSTFNLFDHLRITAGVRYNYEKSLLDYQYQLKMGERIIPKIDSLYPALEEHILLPKLALSYYWDDLTLYASYATGYKPGGFNSTFERPDDLQFKKEMSHNYELGAKASLMDGMIFTDIAFFISYINGQQILRSVPSGQGTFLQNAGQSRNTGLEFSLSTLPIKGFELVASYGYTNAHILKYEVNDSLNYNDHTAPYIPKHTLNLMLAKTIKINNKGILKHLKIQANYQQFGHSYWRIENDYDQDRYGIFNTMLTFDFSFLKLDVWGKNIFDNQYNSYMVSSMGNTFYQRGQPQRWGSTLSMTF